MLAVLVVEKIVQGEWKVSDEPKKPRKMPEILGEKKLIPEDKEFQGLGFLDQQKHTMKFSRDVARKHDKHNRCVKNQFDMIVVQYLIPKIIFMAFLRNDSISYF